MLRMLGSLTRRFKRFEGAPAPIAQRSARRASRGQHPPLEPKPLCGECLTRTANSSDGVCKPRGGGACPPRTVARGDEDRTRKRVGPGATCAIPHHIMKILGAGCLIVGLSCACSSEESPGGDMSALAPAVPSQVGMPSGLASTSNEPTGAAATSTDAPEASEPTAPSPAPSTPLTSPEMASTSGLNTAPAPSNEPSPTTTAEPAAPSQPTVPAEPAAPSQPTVPAEPGPGEDSGGSAGNASDGPGENEPDVETIPRSECPEAPPAETKAPAADRALAVSKSEYAQMMERMDPFEGSRGSLPWHMYTPEGAIADVSASYPLVVVLHGGYGREVEDGNIMVDVAQYLLGSANGLLTQANRDAYPTFILAPHCRVAEGCDFGSNEWAAVGGANFDLLPEPSVAGGTALELIEHVISSYPVDPKRVYLTGNSMGGGGTWDFSLRRPELFAAVLPVSGHTPRQDLLSAIVEAKLPMWAFGAENDYTNPYTDTLAAVELLQEQGGCAWLTTYQGVGHDDALWSSPYLEPGLWPWLFAQVNSSAP